MKDPMRFVDRFCIKHPNFGIPGLARYIAVGSGAAWVIGLVNRVLYGYLTFSAAAVLHGQVWRLLSFMLIPAWRCSSPSPSISRTCRCCS